MLGAVLDIFAKLGEASAGAAAALTIFAIGFRFIWKRTIVPVLRAEIRDPIAKEVTPNGGDTTSLGDRVQRIEAATKEIHIEAKRAAHSAEQAAELAAAAAEKSAQAADCAAKTASDLDSHLAFHKGFELGAAQGHQ